MSSGKVPRLAGSMGDRGTAHPDNNSWNLERKRLSSRNRKVEAKRLEGKTRQLFVVHNRFVLV